MSQILPLNDQASLVSPPATTETGRIGEDLAARFLTRQGYRLVVANFKAPVGRNSKGVQVTGEIDLIALDGDVLCFIEVKTRSSEDFAPIITAVDRRKQRQITRTARVYRKIFAIRNINYRFDVVTVLRSDGRKPQIELKKGFWQESGFRKHSWNHQIWQDFA
jgi:putative endonuclease